MGNMRDKRVEEPTQVFMKHFTDADNQQNYPNRCNHSNNQQSQATGIPSYGDIAESQSRKQ